MLLGFLVGNPCLLAHFAVTDRGIVIYSPPVEETVFLYVSLNPNNEDVSPWENIKMAICYYRLCGHCGQSTQSLLHNSLLHKLECSMQWTKVVTGVFFTLLISLNAPLQQIPKLTSSFSQLRKITLAQFDCPHPPTPNINHWLLSHALFIQ